MSYDEPGIIGPNYKYHKEIKSADEMGMGTDGDQLDDNIAGLGAYAGIIFDGRSDANKSGYNQPLGNTFFVKTGQTCKYGEEEVDMMKYMSNIPTGSVIPGRRGLIPGIAENVVAMIPTDILSSFMDGPNVECVESCQLVGKAGSQTKKCYFVNKRDVEGFSNINNNLISKNSIVKQFSSVYNIGVGALFIYILSKLMSRH